MAINPADLGGARRYVPPLDPDGVNMVPAPELLPDVLPTERLTATGMPIAELRADLRRIDNVRNAGQVALVWAQAALTIAATVVVADRLPWYGAVIAYGVGIVMMGPVFARFAIIGHEAAHKLLFTNKRFNDLIGRWLVAYPAFVPLEIYRRGHFAHHRDEFGPDEPDMNLYVGYPISQRSLRRKLIRDAVGISGWKNLQPLLRAAFVGSTRPVALKILTAQAALLVIFVLVGQPLAYLLLWLVPWMTSWRVINRLRAIAEHGGMERSGDRRRTTHHVHQTALARFWIVPLNTGWHLAHHVDMGVPWRRLPDLHAELVAAGWVVPGLEYPNYRSLWRALSSGADASR